MQDSSFIEILDQAVDGVVQIDDKNRITYINPAAEEMWMVSRRDVVGKNVKILVPEEMQANHDSWVNRNRRTGVDKIVGSSRDVRLERSDGSVLTANLSLSKVEEPGGKISYTAFVKDVTAERQAQEAVGQTLEQALDAVVTIDAENCVTFFNAAAEELWGYDRDEVLGQNVKMLVPKSMQPRHDGFVNANRSTGVDKIVGTSREVPVHRKDGEIRWGNLSLSRVQLSNGEKIYTAFVRDVTEEVERRRQIEILTMVANKTAAAVLVADGKGSIVYANHGFEEQSGYQEREVLGQQIGTLLHGPDTDATTRDALGSHLSSGSFFEGELLLYKRDDTPFWVSFSVNPVEGESGGIEYFVALLTNIDQVKVTALDNDARLSALAETNGVAEWTTEGSLELVNSFLDARSIKKDGEIAASAYGLSNLVSAVEDQKLRTEHRLSKLVEWPTATGHVVLDATFVAVTDNENTVRKLIMCGADATARKEALSEVERAVDRLKASGEKISDCGSLINTIAMQTDMLALNAAIEAAHAGKRGKGFAVVANSVKSLAERSSDSAAQISDIVDGNRSTISDVAETLRRLSA